jgi:transcriptional regulator with XRE-family HTH domain
MMAVPKPRNEVTSLLHGRQLRKPKSALIRAQSSKEFEGKPMLIGERLRQLREQKDLSQGDVERATGFARCYISRIENGHTVPSLETLEKLAVAFGVPLYQIFYMGEGEPPTPHLTPRKTLQELTEEEKEEARFLSKLKKVCSQLADSDRQVLLDLTKRLATRT